MMNKEKREILEDTKLKISISNFQRKESIKMNKSKNKLFKTSIAACLVMTALTGVVFAKDIETFIRNKFGGSTSQGIDIAVNNGYVAEVETEYIKSDGVAVKVDSMLMDDFNLDMNFSVKIDEKYDIKNFQSIRLENFRIVDETGKMIFNTHDVYFETEEETREKCYMGGYSIYVSEEKNDNEFVLTLNTTNPEMFPKSKHLTVTFSKMLAKKADDQYAQYTEHEGDWKFEIDVPEEFYNRENMTYKVKSCNNSKIDVSKIETLLSNTGFKIHIPEMLLTDEVDYEKYHSDNPKSIFDKMALQKEYIETSDGKRFETSRNGQNGYGVPAGEEKIINYYQTFDLTSYDATNEIIVHIFTNKGEEIIIDFERSK